MKKASIFFLSLCLMFFLGGMARADTESATYSAPSFQVQFRGQNVLIQNVAVELEEYGKTITLQYDDGVDDSPGHGWVLNVPYSYRVKFNPPPGKKIKVQKVKFYIADVSTGGAINVLVQTGIDETYATGSTAVSSPGWYEVEVSPKLRTDSFFFVVLESAGFAGGGGDDLHPPIAGRSAQGYPGYWNEKEANFMVRAVGRQGNAGERKVAVLICGDTPYTAFKAVSEGFGTWNGGYGKLMRSSAAEQQYLERYGYDEFWNDVVWMYHILIEQGGFHPDNIYVLFGDGTDWNVSHPSDVPPKYVPKYTTMTDFSASIPNVQKVFTALANGEEPVDGSPAIAKMTENDSLFVWTFDHGSTSGGGGAQIGNSLLCLIDGNMKDTEFASLLHAIPYKRATVFMQQCYSGGFIDNVANSNTFIATACRGDESAWRADDVNPFPDAHENETQDSIVCHHGEFDYYFMSAFEWRSPLGTAINANTSKPNKKISSDEAFNWAYDHDSRRSVSGWEHPQVRDDGGIGSGWIRTWATTAE